MFKRIKSFLANLPVVKQINERLKEKRIFKALNSTNKLKYKIEESVYTEKDLREFKEDFDKISIDYSMLNMINGLTKISFYSTSSQEALETIRKKHYHRETIANYKGMNLDTRSISFNSWFSSEESIKFFISFYSSMLEKNIILEHSARNLNTIDKKLTVSKEEENFINSILYRLLLCDFLSLLSLLLETTYETNKRQKSSPVPQIN